MNKITVERESGILAIAALVALIYSFYLAISYAGQPPLDVHSFRQTQTALTSYWFIHQGFHFAYETPVAGAPWAIPFEFPIYQTIVAFLSKTFDFNLNGTGRIVSYTFLLLTIVPVLGITKRLKLPRVTYLYFVAILLSMPIYVYWGRSFMIETAALFFGIAAIKYFLDYLLEGRSIAVSFAFVFFATLCILQKATTALPILVVLSVVFLIFEAKRHKSIRSNAFIKSLLITGVVFLIPIIIGFAWVTFTDQVKLGNPLGEQLTSAALSRWNWGTLSQKTSSEIWTTVIWGRVLSPNLGALLGAFLLIIPFLVCLESKIKLIILVALSLAIFPLFLFTNLHLVHDYYQTANAAFFAYSVAVTLAMVVAPALGKLASLFILVAIMLSNYIALNHSYLPQIKHEFTKENRDVAIGKILNRELSPELQFVAFGNDWSSTFSYISERKSFNVPDWFKKYDQVISNPAGFLEQGRLGGIISCTTKKPTAAQVFAWVENNGAWKVGETHGCLVVTPEKQLSGTLLESTQCQGFIERAEVELREGKEFVVLAGWLAENSKNNTVPSDVFLKFSNKAANPTYLHVLRVPRLDANQHLKINNDIDVGFSRVIENKFKPGSYEVELFQMVENGYRFCGISKTIEIR